MALPDSIQRRYDLLKDRFDEKFRRLWAAAEAIEAGRGGGLLVSRATGLSRSVIAEGQKELRGDKPLPDDRIRRKGAGRKFSKDLDPTLISDLGKLVEPTVRGDPMTHLQWTIKSTRTLAAELIKLGHSVSYRTVGTLLGEMNFSLQGNRKTLEGTSHEDRDAQFQFISDQAKEYLGVGQPVISVDTKKKELVGPFKNAGQAWRPKGNPEKVKVHDFMIEGQGKVAPYGVYDIGQNEGWVNVGTDHDTSAFAVESIRRWWDLMGKERYPEATRLMITADGGGSNGSRVKLWKVELQKFANETGLKIQVSHFPPGTSKWNKIEHRLFSAITLNWRGKPLVSHEVIISLIEATTTRTGLKVRAALDTSKYPKGLKISKAQMRGLSLTPNAFHGEWNYTLSPQDG